MWWCGGLPGTLLIQVCKRGMLSRGHQRKGGGAMQINADKRRAITTVSDL
jgi:hypothetical protein